MNTYTVATRPGTCGPVHSNANLYMIQDPDGPRWRECPYQRFFEKYCEKQRQLELENRFGEEEDEEIRLVRRPRPIRTSNANSNTHSHCSTSSPETSRSTDDDSSTTPCTSSPPVPLDTEPLASTPLESTTATSNLSTARNSRRGSSTTPSLTPKAPILTALTSLISSTTVTNDIYKSRTKSVCSATSSCESLEMGSLVQEPEELAIELDEHQRPRLKILTSFLGGF